MTSTYAFRRRAHQYPQDRELELRQSARKSGFERNQTMRSRPPPSTLLHTIFRGETSDPRNKRVTYLETNPSDPYGEVLSVPSEFSTCRYWLQAYFFFTGEHGRL